MNCDVEVRDSVNNGRLLGIFRNPPWDPNHFGRDQYQIACCSPIDSVCSYGPKQMPCTITTVTFRVVWQHENYGWVKKGFLVTDSLLKDLLLLREFRLPGESERAAEYRRYSWGG